jgi:hypothetical protein
MHYLRFKAALVVSVLATASASAGPEQFVAGNGGSIFRPVVSGEWVAWIEANTFGLYAHNIATGERRTIVEPTFDPALNAVYGTVALYNFAPWHPQVGINGTTVVWSDRRHGPGGSGFRIYAYDLDTGIETFVGPPGGRTSQNHIYPSISGDRVVWQGLQSRVMLGQIGGSAPTQLAIAGGPLPEISGDTLVWSSGSTGAWIYHRDLSTNQTRVIFQASSLQNPRQHVTDGRYVAWSMRDMTSGQRLVSIMAYDLLTGELITVLEHTGSLEHRSNVAISNGIVVWEDWRNNTHEVERYELDVWGYNLRTRTAFPIAADPGNQHEPWIDGDVVVWVDESSGQRMIGWTRLNLEPVPEPAGGLILLGAAAAMVYKRRCRAGSRRR